MVRTINRLIQICKEREKGYLNASESSEDPKAVEMFKNMAAQSRRFIGALSAFTSSPSIAKLEEPKVSNVFTDWMEFKTDIGPGDNHSITHYCEVGEQHTIAAYEEVLENTMNPQLRIVITEQLSAMKNALEYLDDFKTSL